MAEVHPRRLSPEWLLREDLAYLRHASDSLNGLDQQFTAEVSRWKLEAMAQGGKELALLNYAESHTGPAGELSARFPGTHRDEIEAAWESLKNQYYQLEQSEPQFVKNLGSSIDRFMSSAGAISSASLAETQFKIEPPRAEAPR